MIAHNNEFRDLIHRYYDGELRVQEYLNAVLESEVDEHRLREIARRTEGIVRMGLGSKVTKMLYKKSAVNYDAENDILYISFGAPAPSYVAEDRDGVLIRKAYIDDEITGVTVLDFASWIKKATGLD